MGVVLAARAGYSPYGLVEVLHKLAVRKPDDPGLKILYSTHPTPRDRLTSLGEVLEPRIATLPAGSEPALRQVSADVAPAAEPTRAPAGKKRKPAAAAQKESQAQPESQAPAESAPAIQRGRRGGFGIDPGGIFGR
jgi:predicted Zn-dependent protease